MRSAVASSVVGAAGLLIVLLLLVDGCVCAAAATYKVGDLDAWAVPPASKPDVYVRWGKSVHLALGDAVWFLYPPSQDSVVQVTARAFAACDVATPVLKLADGNSLFNLTTPGRVYFTSAAPGHCHRGQKLTLDVPTAKGTYLQPSTDDVAAIASATAAAAPAPSESPADSLPALSPVDDEDSSAVALRTAAGSVVVAALSFAALLLL